MNTPSEQLDDRDTDPNPFPWWIIEYDHRDIEQWLKSDSEAILLLTEDIPESH